MSVIKPPLPVGPGDNDPAFGQQGTVGFELARSAEVVVLEPTSGNLIGAIPKTGGFTLFRLLPDGQLDPSFGTGGWVAGRFGDDSTWQRPTLIRPLCDGTLFVAGEYRGTEQVHAAPAAALFDGSGVAVADFGEQGRVRIKLEAPGQRSQPPSDSDVPAQRWNDYAFTYRGTAVASGVGVVICLTREGRLATHFAECGYSWYRFPGGSVIFYHCGVQSDGSLIVVGKCQYGALALAYDAYGQLQPSFGFEGTRLFNLPEARFRSLTIRQDDRLLCVGDASGRGIIAGLQADGRDDPSFNDGALLEVRDSTGVSLKRAGVDPSDRLVAGGNIGANPRLYRFDVDGRRDRTFGVAGVIRPRGIVLDGLCVQADGHIVISGANDIGRAEVKRYLGN